MKLFDPPLEFQKMLQDSVINYSLRSRHHSSEDDEGSESDENLDYLPQPEPITDLRENEFFVDKIMDCYLDEKENKLVYLIKWLGYDEKENTWELDNNVSTDVKYNYIQNLKKSLFLAEKALEYATDKSKIELTKLELVLERIYSYISNCNDGTQKMKNSIKMILCGLPNSSYSKISKTSYKILKINRVKYAAGLHGKLTVRIEEDSNVKVEIWSIQKAMNLCPRECCKFFFENLSCYESAAVTSTQMIDAVPQILNQDFEKFDADDSDHLTSVEDDTKLIVGDMDLKENTILDIVDFEPDIPFLGVSDTSRMELKKNQLDQLEANDMLNVAVLKATRYNPEVKLSYEPIQSRPTAPRQLYNSKPGKPAVSLKPEKSYKPKDHFSKVNENLRTSRRLRKATSNRPKKLIDRSIMTNKKYDRKDSSKNLSGSLNMEPHTPDFVEKYKNIEISSGSQVSETSFIDPDVILVSSKKTPKPEESLEKLHSINQTRPHSEPRLFINNVSSQQKALLPKITLDKNSGNEIPMKRMPLFTDTYRDLNCSSDTEEEDLPALFPSALDLCNQKASKPEFVKFIPKNNTSVPLKSIPVLHGKKSIFSESPKPIQDPNLANNHTAHKSQNPSLLTSSSKSTFVKEPLKRHKPRENYEPFRTQKKNHFKKIESKDANINPFACLDKKDRLFDKSLFENSAISAPKLSPPIDSRNSLKIFKKTDAFKTGPIDLRQSPIFDPTSQPQSSFFLGNQSSSGFSLFKNQDTSISNGNHNMARTSIFSNIASKNYASSRNLGDDQDPIFEIKPKHPEGSNLSLFNLKSK
eukprot:NODE_19_length_47148_cov_1.447810.p3 type:complete len:811 gc:universal NODE_19_length_47148_cov_1.447810:21027-18595(-)